MLNLDRPLVVLNLKATDENPERARIIQVAARRFEPQSSTSPTQDHRAPTRYTQIVNPGIPVPADVQERTGLSQKQITAEGKPWPSVADGLSTLLADADLAGYDIDSHDLPLLKAEYARLNRSLPGPDDRKIVDAYALENALNPRTLEHVYASYTGTTHDAPRDATADVDAIWSVIKEQCDAHGLRGSSPSDLMRKAQRDTLGSGRKLLRDGNDTLLCFGKHEGRTLRWVIEHDPNYFDWMYRTIDEVTEHLDAALSKQKASAQSPVR